MTTGRAARYGSSMRFSFSTGTFYHRSLGFSFDLARKTGYDGVEVVLAPSFVLGGVRGIARASARRDVPVLSVHPPFYAWPGWPRAVVERVPRVAGVAHALGASVVVAHLYPFGSMRSPRAARFREALRRGREAASAVLSDDARAPSSTDSAPTTIALETNQYSMRRHRFPLDDVRQLVDFAGEEGCGITLDTCHAGANQEDLLATYEVVRPLLRNVHFSDVRWIQGKPQTHVMPGEGSLPLRDLLVALARDRYDGLVTLELHPREVGLFNRGRATRRLQQALDFMRESVSLAPSTSGE